MKEKQHMFKIEILNAFSNAVNSFNTKGRLFFNGLEILEEQ